MRPRENRSLRASSFSGDLNFDGYPDVKAPREFGATWGRYCVWLYDPTGHRFVRDSLAEQMELLYNLRADPKRSRILANSIGPTNPLIDEYRIEGVGENRPYWPRLIPVRSCFISNASQPRTAIVTQYNQVQPLIRRQTLDVHKELLGGCDAKAATSDEPLGEWVIERSKTERGILEPNILSVSPRCARLMLYGYCPI